MKCNALLLVSLALTACTRPPALAPVPSPIASCDHATDVRDELYFGLLKPGGGSATPEEWQRFLDSVVTPRFEAGFTVLESRGQWRSTGSGEIVREPSRVVIIVHPNCVGLERAIEEIITEYRQGFNQESVGRVTNVVRAAF